MSHQLTFSLSYRPAFGRRDFLVGACNEEAVAWIDRYPHWPGSALLICGAAGCGKSHLASIFSQTQLSAKTLSFQRALSETAQKVVVEDVDLLGSEEALFCLYNQITERKGALLMTARTVPFFKLKDLRSRMNAVPKVFISMPDEELSGAVLMKILYEKQLDVDPDLAEYVVTRLPRSFEAITQFAEMLDILSLRQKQKITAPFIRRVLGEWEEKQKGKKEQLSFFE